MLLSRDRSKSSTKKVARYDSNMRGMSMSPRPVLDPLSPGRNSPLLESVNGMLTPANDSKPLLNESTDALV